jgi:hypothetical protein
MRYPFLFALMLLTPVLSLAAEECPPKELTCGDWQTTVAHPSGTIRLHWTHVYEGRSTVYKMSFLRAGRQESALEVTGQPIFNASKSLAAFPYCADDGCSKEITVVAIPSLRVISKVRLPYEGQIYLKPNWKGRTLVVPVESYELGQRTVRTSEYSMSTLSAPK